MSKSSPPFVPLVLVCFVWSAQRFAGVSAFAYSRRFEPLSVLTIGFGCEAISPALSVATFYPKGYDKATHIQASKLAKISLGCNRVSSMAPRDAQASVLAARSKSVLGFSVRSKHRAPRVRALRALDELITPEKAQELIQNARTRRAATEILRNAIDRQVTQHALDAYYRRHQLDLPWQYRGRELDTRKIQRVIQNTHSRREAAEALKKAFGWPMTLSNLSDYLKRHGLHAPWRREIRTVHVDRQHVEDLIQSTRSRSEAAEILRRALGGCWHPDALSRYLRRHGLTAPWQKTVRAA